MRTFVLALGLGTVAAAMLPAAPARGNGPQVTKLVAYGPVERTGPNSACIVAPAGSPVFSQQLIGADGVDRRFGFQFDIACRKFTFREGGTVELGTGCAGFPNPNPGGLKVLGTLTLQTGLESPADTLCFYDV